MPQGSDQIGPLAGIDADVRFDRRAAVDFSAACRVTATVIGNQRPSRSSWVSAALADFKGYYADLFSQNAQVEVSDAEKIASALRDAASKVGRLAAEARKEQERRETGRQWKRDHDNRNWAEVTWDFLFGEDPPPIGPAAEPIVDSAPAPVPEPRTPLTGTGASGGRSSARASDLRAFATNSEGANTDLSTRATKLRSTYEAFSAGCGWGFVDASGVLSAFDTYIANNGNDVSWANTVAAAFEAAGSDGSVATISNASVEAALAAAGVDASRAPIAVNPASVAGGQVTTGYADDPVNTATGNFVEPEIDLAFAGGCSALAFTRMYNSTTRGVGGFGPGWSSPADERLVLGDEGAVWRRDDGAEVTFPRLGAGWDRAVGASVWLTREEGSEDHGGAVFVISDALGARWAFDEAGHPLWSSRGAGTVVRRVWDGKRLVALVHERGRRLDVEWEGQRIARVRASDGRVAEFSYDEAGRLVEARADSGRRSHEWDDASGLVCRVVDADGVRVVDNTYDAKGRVATQTSPHGRISRYAYMPGLVTEVSDEDGARANTWVHDPMGRLVSVTDAEGGEQRASWDRWGNQVMVTLRDGTRVVREFDDRGRMVTEARPGVRTHMTWDALDRLRRVSVTPEGGREAVTVFDYEGEGRHPCRITDPEGGLTQVEWRENLMVGVVDPTGRTTELEYDTFGDIVAVVNGAGERATLTRDEAGRVVASTSPAGRVTRFEYDERGAVVRRIDPDGAAWCYEYSDAGRLTATVDPLGARLEVLRDESGSDVGSVDAVGRRLSKEIDDLGNTSAVSLPDGSRWEFVHDALSRLKQVTDGSGATWSLEHDAVGHVVAGVDPMGLRRQASIGSAGFGETLSDGTSTWTMKHDPLGRLIDQAGPDGAATAWRHDLCGRVVEMVDPDGGHTHLERDKAGRVTRVTLPSGASYSYEYDRAGRWCASVSTGGARFGIEYDPDGLIVAETWPTGEVVTTEYDLCGRPVRRVEPGKGVTTMAWDACGRVARFRDSYHGRVKYAYDPAGQVIAVTNALGGTTRLDYDEVGNLIRVTDPAGGVTTRTFDAMGRVASSTDPLGRTTRYTYDAVGRMTRLVDSAGVERRWGFDPVGRPTTETVGGQLRRTYHVDPAARSMRVTDHVGDECEEWQWWWNWRGDLVHSTQDGLHTRWEHDLDGRLTRLTRPDGEATRFEYDAEGRVCAFTRDGVGRLAVERDMLGRTVAAHGDGIHVTWQWEGGFLARQVVHQDGQATEVTFQRDQNGRILARTVDGATTSYTYDDAGQLTSARTPDGNLHTFTWDVLGRMTGHDGPQGAYRYSHDQAGQLVRAIGPDGQVDYTYDNLGRRVREQCPTGQRRYTWDENDHLTKVTTLVKDGDRLQAGKEWELTWGPGGDLRSINTTPPCLGPPHGHPRPHQCWQCAGGCGRRIDIHHPTRGRRWNPRCEPGPRHR